ncbi:ATP-binding protein [Paenibacillus filicis]|uniref:histidine kinase n=1 Tax=Paenibacillus gyeongsangnamensis TaxID=3388067 RepID=A0ABT4QA35_9BACL|nr:ATP-binding protein [Paenibacillus filicis]MCZ8513703.1 ATP-binding protein [Paenibacillus filicis]
MKIKLLYKLLAINAIVVIALAAGITIGFRQYVLTLIEQNRMMVYQDFLMFRQAAGQYLLFTSLIVVPLALLFCWAVTRAIVRPLIQMRKLSEQIARGDYQVRLDVTTRDEIGELARSFNDMSAELARIEMLRRNLVADVAHELRTPLSTVRGYTEAMKDGVLPASPELLEKAYLEVERLVRLVEGLHLLSMIEGDLCRRTAEEPAELTGIVRELADLFLHGLRGKSIRFRLDLPDSPCWTTLGKIRAGQVFRNLFDNAVRYTPAGENVTLTATVDKNTLRISVTNTGVEIPGDSMPYLFERFYRVDASRSLASGGTGIGLAIVRDIVTGSGGKVWAVSGRQQTAFHVELPLVPPPDGAQSPSASPEL